MAKDIENVKPNDTSKADDAKAGKDARRAAPGFKVVVTTPRNARNSSGKRK